MAGNGSGSRAHKEQMRASTPVQQTAVDVYETISKPTDKPYNPPPKKTPQEANREVLDQGQAGGLPGIPYGK